MAIPISSDVWYRIEGNQQLWHATCTMIIAIVLKRAVFWWENWKTRKSVEEVLEEEGAQHNCSREQIDLSKVIYQELCRQKGKMVVDEEKIIKQCLKQPAEVFKENAGAVQNLLNAYRQREKRKNKILAISLLTNVAMAVVTIWALTELGRMSPVFGTLLSSAAFYIIHRLINEITEGSAKTVLEDLFGQQYNIKT